MGLAAVPKSRRKRAPKPKPIKVDGLGPKDKERLRTAIRQVWSWSHPRRLCLERAVWPDGFPHCEECLAAVPKVYADHKTPVGELDAGFIDRLWCPSAELQALCRKCHGRKTRKEKKEREARAKALAEFLAKPEAFAV